ncbi:MAG: IclR family transcriptional regulator [Paracoccaceae bacterium]|uniref:IclR family transcriptional regulator n=1 Tax=Seohaeicola saemankumensis TaxID=481181 RepID=UPI001E5C7FD9|nr:IclR family transcriptional regulator [Seohaeicola saemankumensis]MCD1625623.1 IclR family transcriptional regulator [Seohaeicola saemankumensis]
MRNTLRAESGVRYLSDEQRADPLFTNSIARAMQVLAAFHHADRPLSLADIAQGAGIDRSAAQRIVHTLRSLGYIRRDAEDRGYLPGIRILDHTLDFLRMDPLIQRATPVILELRRNVRERVDLSLFDGQRVVYAARMQSKRETFYATLVGHSVPTFCSSGGWAIMARLSEEEASAIVKASDRMPFTPRTLTDPDHIMEEVAATRARGYSIAVEQILLGEVAIGVAVTGPQGRPVAAIHVAGSLSEWTAQDFSTRVAPLALEAARAISHI